MPGDYRPSLPDAPILRTAAIVVMLIGAAGFAVTLYLNGENPNALCLFGSTLVVFAGLGLRLWVRNSATSASSQRSARQPIQPGGPSRWEPVTPEPDEPEAEPVVSSLVDEVVDQFEQNGAQVVVETRRAERCILNVSAANGEHYTVLVNDTPELVDVAEIRALAAIVANNSSSYGFYITAGKFTARAITYASGHKITLIDEGQASQIYED